MPDTTPALALFDQAYRTGTPPWVIDEPQPAIVALEQQGRIRGKVLDAGCGAGEHTILLARNGYDVLGIDFAPAAVALARDNARAAGVDARFAVADALHLPDGEVYDTIIDTTGWTLESLDTTTYRGVVGEAHSEALGVPVGTRLDEPAWLAVARRI